MASPPAPSERLRRALAHGDVVERYLAKVSIANEDECWLWTGAVSGRGHGRFWVEDGFVIIAHRFGYALAHGVGALPATLAHGCDEPLCQNPSPGHLSSSTNERNRAEWAWRRHTPGSPQRDARGSRERATQLRNAARAGGDVEHVAQLGLLPVDRGQHPLW